jgi:hypothetical protein
VSYASTGVVDGSSQGQGFGASLRNTGCGDLARRKSGMPSATAIGCTSCLIGADDGLSLNLERFVTDWSSCTIYNRGSVQGEVEYATHLIST